MHVQLCVVQLIEELTYAQIADEICWLWIGIFTSFLCNTISRGMIDVIDHVVRGYKQKTISPNGFFDVRFELASGFKPCVLQLFFLGT